MTDQEIIFSKLRNMQPEFARYGLGGVCVFGSVAVGDFTPASDVDILIRNYEISKFNYFDLYQLEQKCAAALGRKVDLVTEDALSSFMKPQILAEAVEVFA